jgi:hypothetical protein
MAGMFALAGEAASMMDGARFDKAADFIDRIVQVYSGAFFLDIRNSY